ncbi:WD40 repeat-like protein [Moniliophthora roreri]|nr:WD40 repeat-like protein [Moniliophthora roreri]
MSVPLMHITSDEINRLIYSYFKDSGFEHTAYTLAKESQLEKSPCFSKHVRRGELVELLSKSLLYTEVECHFQGGEAAATCQNAFSLLEPHVCSNKPPTLKSWAPPQNQTNAFTGPDPNGVYNLYKPPSHPKPAEQQQEAAAKRKASSVPSNDTPAEKRARTEPDPIGLSVTDKGKAKDIQLPPPQEQLIFGLQQIVGNLLPHLPHALPQAEKLRLKQGPVDNTTPRDAIRMLGGHKSEVFVCAWNPAKHSLLAAGAKDAVVKIWDLPDPQNSKSTAPAPPDPITITSFHRPDGADLTCLDWNPQGTLLCIASYDSKLRVCDTTGNIVFQTDQHKGPVFTARFSPTGRWIATASLDNTSLLIDIEARRVHRHFKFHKDCCLDVDWINDNVFASCGADRYIHVYGIHEASPLKTFGGHTDEINQIKVNPSGTRLASCSDDMTTRIWNVAGVTSTLDSIPGLGGYSSTPSSDIPVVLKGHTHSVSTVEWFSPPGQTVEYLATGGFDGDIRIWDSVTGQCLHRFSEHKRPVYAVAVAPNRTWMATGGGDGWLHVYNLKNNQKIWSWYAGLEKPGVFEVEWQAAKDGEIYRIATALEALSVAVMDVRRIPAIWDTR